MSYQYLFDPNKQFQNVSGVNNVAGFLRVFYNGTDDRAVTYKDFNGTANPADIPIDNNGRAVVIADEDRTYRLEVYSRDGSLLWSQYPLKTIVSGVVSVSTGNGLFYDLLGRIAVENAGSQSSLCSVATGTNCTASSDSLACGNGSFANIRSITAGTNTTAMKDSLAIGYGCSAGSNNSGGSIAFGSNATASGTASIVGGMSNTGSGSNVAVFGYGNTATKDDGFVSGSSNNSTAFRASALGYFLNATADNQTVVGQFNKSDARQLFIVGDGSADYARHNILTAGKNLYDQREVRVNANLILPTTNWPNKNVNTSLNNMGRRNNAYAYAGTEVLAASKIPLFTMSTAKTCMDYYFLENVNLIGYIQLNFNASVSVNDATTLLQNDLYNHDGSVGKFVETYKIYNSVAAGQVITWPINIPLEYSWATPDVEYAIEYVNPLIYGATLSWDIKIVIGW